MAVAPIVEIDPLHPQPRVVERAVSVLSSGGLLAFPTDTYYGLGCDLFDKRAIERIYQLKQLPRSHELSFICQDLAEISRYAIVDNAAYRVLRRKVPGPYTFILPATRLVPDLVLRRQKTVGIRIPDSPIALEIVRRLGHPLISTSAATPGGEVLIDAKRHQGAARARPRSRPRRRLQAERAVLGDRPLRRRSRSCSAPARATSPTSSPDAPPG